MERQGTKSFTKELIFNDISYTFSMSKCTNGFRFNVSKPLEINYWDNILEYEELQKQFPFLFMKEEKFCEYISQFIQLKQFTIDIDENEIMWMEFWMILGQDDLTEKHTFLIPLENKKREVTENISDLVTYLKKVENDCKNVESSIKDTVDELESKFNLEITGVESTLNGDIRETESKLTSKITAVEVDFKNQIEKILNERINQMENKLLQKINVIEADFKDKIKIINAEMVMINKLYPTLINPNNSIFTLSNGNKTVEKISGGWVGLRGEEIPSTPGVYQFSIRIDSTGPCCNIMIGFCLNSHVGTSGFHRSNCLGMLYLLNGNIYANSGYIVGNYFRGAYEMIITSIIDTNTKLIRFKSNGNQIQEPKEFNLNEGDISKICPCIDLYPLGDKVTII